MWGKQSFSINFFYRYHFGSSDMESKLRAIQTVSVLLQGPSDVGNRTLELSGIIDAVISLCASENITHQQVAVEALIHAAGKAKRASFITANGVALLKDLYKKSENDRIRVRALVVSVQTQRHLYFQRLIYFSSILFVWRVFCRGCASLAPLEALISAWSSLQKVQHLNSPSSAGSKFWALLIDQFGLNQLVILWPFLWVEPIWWQKMAYLKPWNNPWNLTLFS